MKKTPLLILFFHLLTFCTLFSQIYFISDQGQIGYLNTADCSITNFSTPGSSAIPKFPDRYTDIAIHPDGRLFGFTVENEPEVSYLVEIDILNRINKDTLLTLGEGDDHEVTALTISSDGIFFFGRRLFRSFDPETGTIRERGGIGRNYIFQGDLAFWNGKLYGGAVYRTVDTGRTSIFEIDLFDARFSEEVYGTSSSLDTICLSAMAPFYKETAGQIELMVSTTCRAGTDNRRNDFKTLDLVNGALLDFCDFNFPRPTSTGRNRGVVIGMSSEDEFRTNFELRLDLDEDNSSGRLIDHFTIDSTCAVKFPISDKDIWVQSKIGPVDSIQIKVTDGVQNPGEEVIIAPNNPKFSVIGQGTSQLTAINIGQATDSEVAAFIRSILFEITAQNPKSGEREIQTQLFSAGTSSDIARSFIPVQVDERLFAGEDVDLEICDGTFLNLFRQLPGAQAGGRWEPLLSEGNNTFSPFEDEPGIFKYIVEVGGCQPDTAELNLNVLEAPPVNVFDESELFVLSEFCQGDTIIWDFSDQLGALEYVWDNDWEGPTQFVTETGTYQLIVYDPSVNCTFEYDLWAAFRTGSIINEETREICAGDTFTWLDQQYTIFQDTTLCSTSTNATGCEIQDCLQLNVRSTGQPISQSVSICAGESYDFYGRDLTDSGIYTQVFQGEAGCDSTITLQLNSFPTYSFQIDTFVNQGETVKVAGIEFSSGGTYNIPFQTVAGCDSTYQINIDVVSSVNQIEGQRMVWASNLLKLGQEGYQLRSDKSSEVLIKRMVIVDVLGRQHFQVANQGLDQVQSTWQPQIPGAYWCFAELSVGGKDRIFHQKVIVVD